MNIAIISGSAHYHHLSQKFIAQNDVNVVHYGASESIKSEGNYCTIPLSIPYDQRSHKILDDIIKDIDNRGIDLVLTSSTVATRYKTFQTELESKGIPFFFPDSSLTDLELNRTVTKKILNELSIPTTVYQEVDGKYLFENFKKIPRPFVIKIMFEYLHGKQTLIVNESNYHEVYHDLFSKHLVDGYKITNINLDTKILIEEYVNLKTEYSYHALCNSIGWKYLGSARDYKRAFDNDIGHNVDGMGCYTIDHIDDQVHVYADKILTYLKNKGKPYKGFLFLGIGVDENDVPRILEINTRAGDPELCSILETIENDLFDLFYTAAIDDDIPEIVKNERKAVSVVLANRIHDWTKPASYLPTIKNVPDSIIQSLDNLSVSSVKHSTYTSSGSDINLISREIYNYLDSQNIGQFYYRRDIGQLK